MIKKRTKMPYFSWIKKWLTSCFMGVLREEKSTLNTDRMQHLFYRLTKCLLQKYENQTTWIVLGYLRDTIWGEPKYENPIHFIFA